jgi:TPR repeat protein
MTNVKNLIELANNGDANAQYELGKRHLTGEGLEIDSKEAVKWFKLASEQKHPKACCELAACYLLGIELGTFFQDAANLLKVASEGGVSWAKHLLGERYFVGKGVEQDEAKAAELFKEAALCLKAEAEQGDTMAMYHLGSHYSRDDLNLANPDEAGKWYAMSIDGLRAMADSGNAEAQFMLACCYKEGLGVEANTDEALRLYHLAADRGHARSQAALGLEYVLLKEYDKSLKYLKLAAVHGFPKIRLMIRRHYKEGLGVEKDDKKASEWFALSMLAALGKVEIDEETLAMYSKAHK